MKKTKNIYKSKYSFLVLKEIDGKALIENKDDSILKANTKFILLETKDLYWRKILFNGVAIGWIAAADEMLIKC